MQQWVNKERNRSALETPGERMNHRGSNGVKDLFDVTAGRHIHPRGEQERVNLAVLRCVQRFACAGENVCRVGCLGILLLLSVDNFGCCCP